MNQNTQRIRTFTTYAGFALPADAIIIITSCEEIYTAQGETEYYIVFDASTDSIGHIKQLVTHEGQIKQTKWKAEPIAMVDRTTQLARIFNEEFESTKVIYISWQKYAANYLIIIDPIRNRVLFSWNSYSLTR